MSFILEVKDCITQQSLSVKAAETTSLCCSWFFRVSSSFFRSSKEFLVCVCSLPLRFWVNILRNPHFILDVHVTEVVDASLHVIAQTFMDACTKTEHKLSRVSEHTFRTRSRTRVRTPDQTCWHQTRDSGVIAQQLFRLSVLSIILIFRKTSVPLFWTVFGALQWSNVIMQK